MKNKKLNNAKRPLKGLKIALKSLLMTVVIVLVIILGLNAVVCFNALPNVYENNEYKVQNQRYDCIMVLGCGVNGYDPSLMLKDRLDTAINLYKSGVANKILMSGDHGGQYYNEVGVMKVYAMQCGVPASDIFMDHAGFSTYESLYRAKGIFGIKSMVAVTQEYHLYRTVYLGQSLGLDIIGVAAKDIRYFGQTYRDLREIFARGKDILNALFKPKPSMPLGEKIDITGNGNVTNDDAFYNIANKKGLKVG